MADVYIVSVVVVYIVSVVVVVVSAGCAVVFVDTFLAGAVSESLFVMFSSIFVHYNFLD